MDGEREGESMRASERARKRERGRERERKRAVKQKDLRVGEEESLQVRESAHADESIVRHVLALAQIQQPQPCQH
jgi:hypothetical protein